MGYDLHITRRKQWSDTGRDISAQEWLAYVEQDPELTLSPENGDTFVRWNGESENPEQWIDWRNGTVFTKSPDEALIGKMIAIARALNATVQGDDGEIYREAGRTTGIPQAFPARSGARGDSGSPRRASLAPDTTAFRCRRSRA